MRRRTRIAANSAVIGPPLALGIAVAAAAALFVTGRVHPLQVAACITMEGPPPTQPGPPAPEWWQWAILACCVAGFAIGHATSHVRSRLDVRRPPNPETAAVGSRVVQIMIVVFLLVGVVLAAYEALSVVPDVAPPTFWPISYYVRCVNDVAPYQALAATTVVAFLLGHWFCHPSQSRREGLL